MRDRTLKREEVQKILTVATNVVRESLIEGNDVLWVDLCTFTWKKKPKTKKEAKLFEENPALAQNDKLRVEPVPEMKGMGASGGIIKESKKIYKEKQEKKV